jgi:hypothetical protein
MVAGSALVVDYVLTITISVASGADAIFSFLPIGAQRWKLIAEVVAVALLIDLNLRGIKESVNVLVPIFLVFVASHLMAILYGIVRNAGAIPFLVTQSYQQAVGDAHGMGLWGMLLILLRAYSLGGGTYTGIEAVSNSMGVLREPRIETGKRTMVYMASSLAFTAAGLILCYLLTRVTHAPGKTLNAALFEALFSSFAPAGLPVGSFFVLLLLLSEGGLLMVASQTGFIGGPQVIASMAVDSWLPHRFSLLSDRLVIRNGVLLMGLAALGVLLYTGGSVRLLVVMYSINVFLTFTLSQLGMCKHWWEVRKSHPDWKPKLLLNGIGLVLTTSILFVTTIVKFAEGGWFTVVVTSALIVLCYAVRGHYNRMRGALHSLDDTLMNIPFQPDLNPVPPKEANAPTAVLIVRDFDGIGVHSLLNIPRLFPDHFKNVVFVSVAVIDSSKFKGVGEIENLRHAKEEDLKSFVEFANCLGWYAEHRFSLGVDLIEELERLCKDVARDFPSSVFFAGKLVFQEETLLGRMLHNHTPMMLQQKLQFEGLQMMILPIRVFTPSRIKQVAA